MDDIRSMTRPGMTVYVSIEFVLPLDFSDPPTGKVLYDLLST